LGSWLGRLDEFDGILAVRLDRVSRSLAQFLALWQHLDSAGKTIISVSEQLDFSTPVGRLLVNMLVMFSQFEREMIQSRVKDAYRANVGKGASHGSFSVWPRARSPTC
jgi:site-specific DNA recombinase